MAHYAFLDENNIVTEVITGKNENEEGINWEEYYGNFRGQVCKRTSYNTRHGIHTLGGTPFRKHYAQIGYTYDENRDAFIPPKTLESFILDENTCTWKPPISKPTEPLLENQRYYWNEDIKNWEIIQK
jgi:hypothetical protein